MKDFRIGAGKGLLAGVLCCNPGIDALPPVIEPAEPRLVVRVARHVGGPDTPPVRPDEDVAGQALPDVADADQPVQAGVRHEDHISGRAGVDRRECPAQARREDIGHRGGTFGQVVAVAAVQPGDRAAPPLRGPVAAFGKDEQGAAWVEAGGQAADQVGVVTCAAALFADERVREPVGQHVRGGVELQRLLHDDAGTTGAGADQVVHEQQRVARARVAAEHDDGAVRRPFGWSRYRDVQPAGAFRRAVDQVEQPAHDPVVAGLVRLGVQPAAEAADDPQAQHDRQRGGLGDSPDEREAHHPQRPHPVPPAGGGLVLLPQPVPDQVEGGAQQG